MVHAIGAPIYAAAGAWIYVTRHGHYSPLQTAVVFVSFVIAVDALFIAPVVEGSFEMFASLLGTWIPFVLIFLSAYLTGRGVRQRLRHAA